MTEMPIDRPAVDQIAAALAAFQAEMPTVAKTKTATVKSDKGSYGYTYAGLADVCEAAMPILAKHGLSFVTLPGQGVLTGLLLHTSGQSLTASLPISGSTPQQVGSSLTYMRRYLLGCMTGIVTDDDDDGQTAQAAPRRKPDRVAPAPSTTTVRREPPEPPLAEPNVASVAQVQKVNVILREQGVTDRASALTIIGEIIGRDITSSKDLTKAEAHRVIETLETPAVPDDEAWGSTGGAA